LGACVGGRRPRSFCSRTAASGRGTGWLRRPMNRHAAKTARPAVELGWSPPAMRRCRTSPSAAAPPVRPKPGPSSLSRTSPTVSSRYARGRPASRSAALTWCRAVLPVTGHHREAPPLRPPAVAVPVIIAHSGPLRASPAPRQSGPSVSLAGRSSRPRLSATLETLTGSLRNCASAASSELPATRRVVTFGASTSAFGGSSSRAAQTGPPPSARARSCITGRAPGTCGIATRAVLRLWCPHDLGTRFAAALPSVQPFSAPPSGSGLPSLTASSPRSEPRGRSAF